MNITILQLVLLAVPIAATFTELPKNHSVEIGQDVTFRCTAQKSAESLIYSQWKSNTGSLLGYHQGGVLPGHQGRYSYIKEVPEELHLKIERVSLDDDGRFECQMLRPDEGPIRAAAHLNILVPPTTIQFDNYQSGSLIDINENTRLNITCMTPNVKPEPKIYWYINGRMIEQGVRLSSTLNFNKTFTTHANLQLVVKKSDHNNILTCEAYQEETRTKIRTNTTLNVLYAPDEPLVKIMNGEKFVRSGENVSISCHVHGGNPPPNVSWYLDDKLIDSRFVFDSSTQESQNMYSFIAGPTDNMAKYECRAQNNHVMEPLKKTIKVEVTYAPESVETFGESSIRYGAFANIQCRSFLSNPVSQISWLVNGHPVTTSVQSEHIKENGRITVSNLTINSNDVNVANHQIRIECTARNVEGSASKEHIIKILAPPMTPRISGLEEMHYFEGDILNVTCEAHGGNPLSELTWYRGYEKLGARNEIAGDSSISSLSLRLDRTMNSQRIKCEAMNSALDEPLIESRQLNIYYTPRRLIIRPPEASSHHLFVGKPARLLCSAPASNPAAHISWHFYTNGNTNPLIYNGDTIKNESTRESSYSVENIVSFLPTEGHDGTIVRCIASHPEWKTSINTTYPLNVLYPPRMLIDNPVRIVVSEGESFRENVTVKGNPAVSSWQWRKNGVPFDHTIGKVFARGEVLSGKNLKSTDAGTYTMIATNSVGSTNITLILTVEYSARIISISSPVIASDGDTVILECEADGEPRRANMVGWYRNGKQLEAVHRGDTRAVLRLNATKRDSGEYMCRADNGIGVPAESKAFVLVNSAPRIIHLPLISKAAGSLGGVARARCRTKAVPTAEFYWDRGGHSIKGNSSKYSMVTVQLDYLTFESTLWIKNLAPDDYNKQIRCTARNSFGSDSITIPIGPLSPPDTPANLRMANATSNTISVAWDAGFDGGSDQIFEVKYQKYNEELVHLVNTTHSNLRLSGLQPAKIYEFQIRAINGRGFSSDWTRPPLTLATLNEDGIDIAKIYNKRNKWPELFPIILVIIVAFALANIILVCYLCNRNRKKKLREKTEIARTAINGEGVRPVQMYGTMVQNDGSTRLDVDDIPDRSEDDHSVRTMIEVSPNGYMQPIDPSLYERSCLVEYQFDPRDYSSSRQGTLGRNSTYTNIPYPEPPNSLMYSDRSLSRDISNSNNNNLSPHHSLSTFIHPCSGVRAGPIHYSQLDGDLV